MTRTANSVIHPAAIETDDEARLVRAAQRGATDCFEILVTRYERRIFRLAKNVVQNESDAEDVIQDAFLKAFEHIDDFKGNSRFYTWLVRITINQALMELRKRRPNQLSIDDPFETEGDYLPREIEDWGPTPEQYYSQQELAEILSDGMAALSPSLRIVFQLRDLENASIEETSKLTGLSIPTVKTRLLRARLQLREKLNRFFRDGNRYSTTFMHSVAKTSGILRAAPR
jgi:RNA polymerase sigma-70 factor, ECF subfamily